MNRVACFVAGFALASFAPSIVTEWTSPRSAVATRSDDTDVKEESAARKRKKIEQLLTEMKQKEITKRTLEASLSTFTEMGLPEDFQTCFMDHFDLDHVVAFTTDIYVEHLEESTIDALITFYKSDEGKAFTEALPDITIDALKKGTEYGKEVGTECAKGR